MNFRIAICDDMEFHEKNTKETIFIGTTERRYL